MSMDHLNSVELQELGGGSRRAARGGSSLQQPACSAPRTALNVGIENASFQGDDHETRFRCPTDTTPSASHNREFASNAQIPFHRDEHSPRSDEEPEPDYSDHSVDYGFIFALVFLVSGIVLVVIAYTIPRESKVNPDLVTARQMEKLEMYYAQLGSHLDKCIIAGLGLLTLGGMLLSILLMVSICKGELYRRRTFALSRRPRRTYGSINMRMRQLAEGDGRDTLVECEPSTTDAAMRSDKRSPGLDGTREQ